MQEALFFNDKKYISARRAGELTGYTSDYICQLCRGGKINSQLIGKTRYVCEEQILDYKKNFGGVSRNSSVKNSKKVFSSYVSRKKDIRTKIFNNPILSEKKLWKEEKKPAIKYESGVLYSDLATQESALRESWQSEINQSIKYIKDKSALFPSINKSVDFKELSRSVLLAVERGAYLGRRNSSVLERAVMGAAVAVAVLFLVFISSSLPFNSNKLTRLTDRIYEEASLAVAPAFSSTIGLGLDRYDLVASVFALSSIESLPTYFYSYVNNIIYKVAKPWYEGKEVLLVTGSKKADSSEPKVVSQARTVTIIGTEKGYVDSKIEALRNYFDVYISNSSFVNRPFLSRQNDVIASIVNRTSSSDSSSDSSGLSSYDAWTHPDYGGSATTSLLTFSAGLLSVGSSTIVGDATTTGMFSVGTMLHVASGGFGTTTLTGLSINGSATSTSNVGWNITTGCYAINGTCLSTSGGSGASTTLLADFNTWTNTNNFTGSIGLSSSTPFARLSVNAGVGEHGFVVGSSTATSFIVDKNGSVGIGTASPTAKLQISATPAAGGTQYVSFLGTSGTDWGIGLDNAAVNNLYIGGSNVTGEYYWRGNWSNSGMAHNTFQNPNGGSDQTVVEIIRHNAVDIGDYLNITSNGGSQGDLLTVDGVGRMGLSTTTPDYSLLTLATSTVPQLTLSVGGDINQWAFRNAGGNFYLSTTTVAGTATTSISALEIAGDGFGTTTVRGLRISGQATSTSNVGWNITTGCYAINGTCLSTSGGSGASTTLLADFNTWSNTNNFTGKFGIGTTSNPSVLTISPTSAQLVSTNPVLLLGTSTLSSASAAGTYIGARSPTGFSGDYISFQNFAGSNLFKVSSSGTLTVAAGTFSGAVQNIGSIFLASNNAKPGFVINSAGSNYGLISNVNSTSWSLGYGSSNTVLGTSAITWNDSGNVGVGTTTPWAQLSVNPNGIGSGPEFVIGSSTSTHFVVTNAGKVGVGTTNPSAFFEVGDNGVANSASIRAKATVGQAYLEVDAATAANIRIGQSGTINWNINVPNNGTNSLYFTDRTGDRMVLQQTTGNLGIGTTTPTNKLTITDSSASQLTLSDSIGINQWAFRNTGGNLYLSTTTVAGTATTSISALEIAGDGFGTTTVRGLRISGQATSTSNVGWNITTGCYAINGTCLSTSGGSGASTTLLADTNTWSAKNVFNAKLGVSTSTNNATFALQGTAGTGMFVIASSTGEPVITLDQYGNFTQSVTSSNAFSVNMASGTPVFEVDTSSSDTNAGLDITAATGQTANLLNFYSSGGTYISGFTAAGGLYMNMSSSTAINLYDGSGNAAFVVSSSGKAAGVGTSTLAYALTVQDNQSANYVARIDNANTGTDADGLLITLGIANASRTTSNYFIGFATGDKTVAGKIQGGASAVAYTTSAADLAEYFRASDVNDKPRPGEIVMLDKGEEKSVRRAEYNIAEPLGIISTNPGFIGNAPICRESDIDCDTNYTKYNTLVAIAGQVPVRISEENGPIQIGDYLTISSTTPGAAAKMVESGYIVGVVISNATTTTFGSTTAHTVNVFVKSGWREVESSSGGKWVSLLGYIKELGIEFGQNFVRVTNLITNKLTADKVETKELCIDGVCVTKDQLQALVNMSGVTTVVGDGGSEEPATTTLEVVEEPVATDVGTSTPAATTDQVIEEEPAEPPATTTPEVVEEAPAPEPVVETVTSTSQE